MLTSLPPHVAVPAEALNQPNYVGQRSCQMSYGATWTGEAVACDFGPACSVGLAKPAVGGKAGDSRSVGK